jgi:hypothetical protein
MVLSDPVFFTGSESARQEEPGSGDGNVVGGTINNSYINQPPLRTALGLPPVLVASASSSSSNKITSQLNTNLDLKRATGFSVDDFLFVLEIRPMHKPGLSAMSEVSRQTVLDGIRTKADHGAQSGREMFLGEVVTSKLLPNSSLDVTLLFNSQHHSWDYSWRSNRWSATNEQHVVDIVVLRYATLAAGDLLLSSCYSSSPFYIISSHKKPGQRLVSSDMEVLNASQVLSGLADPRQSAGASKSAKQTSAGTTAATVVSAGGGADDKSLIAEGAQSLMSLLVRPTSYLFDRQRRPNDNTDLISCAELENDHKRPRLDSTASSASSVASATSTRLATVTDQRLAVNSLDRLLRSPSFPMRFSSELSQPQLLSTAVVSTNGGQENDIIVLPSRE